MTTRIEWGIAHRAAPDRVHAGPFTFAEAMDWLVEWEKDGGDPRDFKLMRREVGEWMPAGAALQSELDAMDNL